MKIRDEINQTIFLSYSHDDIEMVKKIEQRISKHYDVWVDYSEIHAKEEYNEEISKGIENCDLFVSVISNTYIDKPFCKDELTYAQKRNKDRIPLFIENINLSSQLSFIFGIRESDLRIAKGYNEVEDVDTFTDEICERFLEHIEQYFIIKKIRETGKKIELKTLNINFDTIDNNYRKVSRNGYFEKTIYDELYPSFDIVNRSDAAETDEDNFENENVFFKETPEILQKNFANNNDMLIDYIQMNKEKHIIIYGEGGSGKTVAVKRVYEHFSKNGIPVLYVPLNKLDEDARIEKYIEDVVAGPNNWSIIRKLATMDIYDKRVVLILDGYNEITENIIKATNHISEIMSWGNIQVILTSRYDCSDIFSVHNVDRIDTLHMMPLVKEKVIAHLTNKGIDCRFISDKLISLISNPLMLILYSESDITEIYSEVQSQKSLYYYYPLGISEKPNTQGKIIYNYLISQLYKKVKERSVSVLECFFAIEFALPLLAFFIINDETGFQMKKDAFSEYLTFALNDEDVSNKYISHRFANIQTGLGINDNNFVQNINVRIINCILNELSLVCEKDGQLEFAHQTLRDFFAAMFLSKQIQRLVPKQEVSGFINLYFSLGHDKNGVSSFAKDVLSSQIFSEDVLSFCTTILEEDRAKPQKTGDDVLYPGKEHKLSASNYSSAERILSLYRNEEGIKVQNSVANLIGIMRIARKRDLSNCDFSSLDLRSSNLARIGFTAWIKENFYPSSFENAIIDMKSFIKSGHHSPIMKLFLDFKKNLYSIDSEGIINVWKLNCDEPIRSYSVNIDDDIVDLSVSRDGEIIAVLTHQVIYIYDVLHDLTDIKTTTHYYKYVRFNDNGEPEVTYDVNPLTWKGINEEYEFDNRFDFPARASAVSPDGVCIVKSEKSKQNETMLNKYSIYGEKMEECFSGISDDDVRLFIRSVKFSPDGSMIVLCANNHLILLDARNMIELNRAIFGDVVNDACFVDDDTIVAAVGESLLYFDAKLNSTLTIENYKIQSFERGFYYDDSYWEICHNKTIIKFDRNMNVDVKRQISSEAFEILVCGKDMVTNEFRLFFIENSQCYMYNFYTDEVKPAVTNYIIDEDIENNSKLFPYQIYKVNRNALRCVDRNNKHNIKIYKDYGVFNIYKCNFHNVKGDIINNLELIRQEGGQIDE